MDDGNSLVYFLLMAFLGGLILNFMPCVLPVISLKLFGLIKHSELRRGQIFLHNLFYTLGILATFLALSIAIIALKNSGHSVGWGIQLQSPTFIAIMILALFVFALNLFGLFEFPTPGGSVFGNLSFKEGVIGDFMSGVIATILSTPCSAPFLGTALTFAFTHDSWAILLIFTFIGLGLATPFMLTSIFPQLVRLIPRPGPWMEQLKKFLGLTLILTIVWLIDVFVAQVGGGIILIKMNTTLALIFFAIYMKKGLGPKSVFALILFALPLGLTISTFIDIQSPITKVSSQSQLLADKNRQGVNWQPWSTEAMETLKEQQKWVFMDFTAKWCFTCKVNEKVVLDTDGFKALVARKKLVLLLADWTKRDPVIGEWLHSQGMAGVPAYFIQKPDGTLINLGETISLSEIEKHLN